MWFSRNCEFIFSTSIRLVNLLTFYSNYFIWNFSEFVSFNLHLWFLMISSNSSQSASTSTDTSDSTMVSCRLWNKSFSRRGINIHISRSHPSDDSLQDVTPSVTDEFNSELLSCPHCPQEVTKLFRNNRGLQIHKSALKILQVNHHFYWRPILYSFAVKKSVQVLRRIPKGARPLAANRLQHHINLCISSNSELDWTNLMLFAYSALRVPCKNTSKSLVSKIKDNIINSHILPPPESSSPKKKNAQISTINCIERKVAEGDIRNAIRILSSDSGIADCTQNTFEELISKHPPPSRSLLFPPDPEVSTTQPIFFNLLFFGLSRVLLQHQPLE